jgi:hypothetical protein
MHMMAAKRLQLYLPLKEALNRPARNCGRTASGVAVQERTALLIGYVGGGRDVVLQDP